MLRKIAIAFGVLTSLFIVTTVVFGLTAIFDCTVQIVDSTGNVMDGVASATVAAYNSTVRVVDSTGHVLDSLGLLAVSHDTSLTGAGTPVSPLASNLATDNTTLQGDGRPGTTFQLKAVQHDTTLTGAGTVASPLMTTGSTAGIGGNKLNTCGADGYCNVDNFGAIPNPGGFNDSEPAFMAAQTAAVTSKSQAVYIPGARYYLNFPFWLKGSTVNGWDSINLMGAGGLSRSTVLTGNYILVMPPNGTSSLDGGCGAGVLWTTPLAGATGQSMCDKAVYYIELKQLLWDLASDKPLNGFAAFSAEFWFQADVAFNTSGSYLIKSGGTDGTVLAEAGPLSIGYSSTAGTGHLNVVMNIGGTAFSYNTADFDLATAAHFYQVVYDGAKIQVFVDGVQSGSDVLATGTTTDKPFYNLELGGGSNWPDIGGSTGFHGKLFGLRFSTVARAASTPTSALTCDANTLLLLNGVHVNSDESTASASGPFVQEDCLRGSANNGGRWYFMHPNGLSSNTSPKISGIRIDTNQWAGYGLILSNAENVIGEDIFINAINGIGFEEENNSYFGQWTGLQSRASSVSDAMWLWAGHICNACTFLGSDYPVVDAGGIHYNTAWLTPSSQNKACYVSFAAQNPFVEGILTDFQCDNEGQFAGTLLNFSGGNMTINNSALIGGNPAAIRMANGTNLTLNNDLIVSTTSEYAMTGFGATTEESSTITFNSDFGDSKSMINNALPPVDNSGIHYEMHGMSGKVIAGTTAGTATLGCTTFTDQEKNCTVNLVGYRNSSATTQKIMMPAGITVLGFATELTGAAVGFCDGVQVATGDNADCASSASYPCCTGAGTGTCNTLQFITLPINMAGTQTGLCQFQGL